MRRRNSRRKGSEMRSTGARQKSRQHAGGMKGKCINRLRRDGVGFFGVDTEVGDGFFDDFFFDFSVEEKLVERGEGDEARVDFKKIAERFAVIAAAEAVGAERRD